MDILNSFMGQALIAQIGEIVLFANTVTMAMPTRWRKNMAMNYFQRRECRQRYGASGKIIKELSLGSGRNSGKQLVFKKSKRNPKRIEAVHGASLPREFERQGMAKLFNKKIKTRFPHSI